MKLEFLIMCHYLKGNFFFLGGVGVVLGGIGGVGVWRQISLIFSSVWVLRNCRKIEENNFVIIIIFLLFRTFCEKGETLLMF